MRFNHIHLSVRDLPAAIVWMREVWKMEPGFASAQMASFPLGSVSLLLDSADEDSVSTVGFETDDCDRDYEALMKRGATAAEGPSDKPWGTRTAYIEGPGRLRFELEQVLE